MGKLKTGLLVVTGATIGVLTLRKLRNRETTNNITEPNIAAAEVAESK